MAKVSLLIPCFVDQFSPQIGMDVVRVLRRIGYEVDFPEEQTCCGQPAFNTGYWDEARSLAERFVRVFGSSEMVVCPSGSCTTMVKVFYPDLLAGTPLHDDAVTVGQRVHEFAQFLVNVARVTNVGASFPYKVTIHDSCHGLRELHLKQESRDLLKHVRGLELVDLPYGEECCGFGGAFSVKYPMISAAMGDTKAGNIEKSGADYVTASDPSCLMHIEGILRRKKSKARTIHVASILAQTAGASEQASVAGKGTR